MRWFFLVFFEWCYAYFQLIINSLTAPTICVCNCYVVLPSVQNWIEWIWSLLGNLRLLLASPYCKLNRTREEENVPSLAFTRLTDQHLAWLGHQPAPGMPEHGLREDRSQRHLQEAVSKQSVFILGREWLAIQLQIWQCSLPLVMEEQPLGRFISLAVFLMPYLFVLTGFVPVHKSILP